MGPKKKDKKAKAEEAAVEESGLHSDDLIIRVKTHSNFFFFFLEYDTMDLEMLREVKIRRYFYIAILLARAFD